MPRFQVSADAIDPLPPVRTAAGDLANPFATLAKGKRQLARLLALAFAESQDDGDIAGILRALARAVDFSIIQLSCMREGPHLQEPSGMQLPFELARAYAILYLAHGDMAHHGSACGLSLGCREVITREYARHFVGAVAP